MLKEIAKQHILLGRCSGGGKENSLYLLQEGNKTGLFVLYEGIKV